MASASASAVPDKKTMQVIYPQYLDANLKPSEGRRISVQQAVPNPSFQEIADALSALGYRQVCFDPSKSLPSAQAQERQNPAPRGVFRVAIKTPANQHYIKKSEFDVATRAPVVASIPSKHQLLLKIAAHIRRKAGGSDERPKLPPTAQELAAQVIEQAKEAAGPEKSHGKKK